MARNTNVQADHHAPAVTRQLAQFIAGHPSRGWDDVVDREAHRTFANWVGCALGAARHETVNAALAAVQELAPAPQAGLLGRPERVDMANAALINGISSHTYDFDDTHLKTIIHPAGPVASAALALAECRGLSGRDVIDALVIGVEVSCRVGNAIYPHHYDRGWHITGSTGMLGSAAACSRLLRLSAEQTQMALGIAASQPIGLREQFGTMTKPFHPGAAAKAGLMSALLARHGFTSSPRALEAPRGLLQVFSDKVDWTEISRGLGESWEIALNTYKPFACGIVIHPSIDGCVQLRERGITPELVRSIHIKVHPLVLELTGKKTPRTGLEGKFSVYHSCAVGLIHGRAGEHEYTDAVVNDPRVVALRDKVSAEIDESIAEDAADLELVTADGVVHRVHVAHAVGSLAQPMSDAQLRDKFVGQASATVGAQAAQAMFDTAMSVARIPGPVRLGGFITPGSTP
jgi:2-methylcitrate dehydratase PrpD